MARIPTFDENALAQLGRTATLSGFRPPTVDYSGLTRISEEFAQRQLAQEQSLLAQKVELDATEQFATLQREYQLDPNGFAENWGAYQEGVSKGLKTATPEQQIALNSRLQSMGVNGTVRLEEQKFLREQALTTVEANRAWQRTQDVIKNSARETGDEEGAWEGRELLREQADRNLGLGIWSDQQYEQALLGIDRNVPTEMLYGQVENMLRAGDVNGARGIVEAVFGGAWFEDKDYARALAGRLGQLLEGPATGLDATGALKLLDILETTEAEGRQVDLQQAQALSDIALASGSASQRIDAINKLNAISEFRVSREILQEGDIATLESAKGRVLSQGAQMGLTAEAITKQVGAYEKRVEEIKARGADNDRAALGGQLPPVEGVPFDEWPAAVAQRNARAAAASGVRNRGLLYPYSKSERGAFSEQFRERVRFGDIEGASSLMDKILSPAGDNQKDRARIAMGMRDQSGTFAVAGLMRTFGVGQEAVQAMRLSVSGQRVGELDLGLDPLQADEFLAEDDVAGALRGMVLGDAQLLPDANGVVRDIYVAAALEAKSRGVPERATFGTNIYDAAAEKTREVLAPLFEVHSFDNGATVPARLFTGGPEDNAVLVQDINDTLSSNERLGLAPGDTANPADFYPQPIGSGAFAIMYGPDASYVLDPEADTPTPLIVNPPPPEEAIIREARGEAPFDTFSAKFNRAVAATPLQIGLAKAPDASKAFGSNQTLVEALAMAQQATPAEAQEIGRMASFGALPANVGAYVDRDAVVKAYGEYQDAQAVASGRAPTILPSQKPGFAQSVNPTAEGVAPFTLAAYTKFLEDRFGPTPEAVAAAYWLGPEAAEQSRQQFGDDWYRKLDSARLQAFIGRFNAARR